MEYILPFRMMRRILRINFLLILLSTNPPNSQPDNRFLPFDWIQYRFSGSITSLSEGYSYLYIGTETGGIKRYNLFSNDFDEPITIAQGLKENSITAIHFDHATGILWVCTPNFIQYSFTREGSWNTLEIKSTGLSKFDRIKKIGSSEDYIWLKGNSIFLKLDHSSAVVAGMFPYPDELAIQWSGSFSNRWENDFKKILNNYPIMGGWISTGNTFIDHLGRSVDIISTLIGRHGDVWVGCDNGVLLHARQSTEIFYIVSTSIPINDVAGMKVSDDLIWVGGTEILSGFGVSWLNMNTNESFTFEFDSNINMSATPVYSIWDSKSTLWAGGDDCVLVYDKGDRFWRTLDIVEGIPEGNISNIIGDDDYVWVSSDNGICRLDAKSWKEDPLGFEYLFNSIKIFDLELIEKTIWIASRSGLFLFNSAQPQLINATDFLKTDFGNSIYDVTALTYHDENLYASCNIGITVMDFYEKNWKLLFPVNFYQDKEIFSMEVNNRYIFLGLNNGIIRLNKRNGFIREYQFPFIGKVNQMKLEKNFIFLGTTTGLIKFKWTREK
tara:strand:- start:1511 stop:3172 length:1662 start_codon:yes stop_codon:yes gene_type:complete